MTRQQIEVEDGRAPGSRSRLPEDSAQLFREFKVDRRRIGG